jgi:hypothetical protein
MLEMSVRATATTFVLCAQYTENTSWSSWHMALNVSKRSVRLRGISVYAMQALRQQHMTSFVVCLCSVARASVVAYMYGLACA